MYSGFWDIVGNAISNIGINANTAAAIARAYASPTLANIETVRDAFEAAGTTAPPEIIAALQKRYADSVAAYPSVYAQTSLTDALPWIALGVLGFMALRRTRR